MTAIILAGGKSRRMGNRDKAFIEIEREPLIRRQLRLLKKDFKKIIIVANAVDKYKGFKGVRVVPDAVAGQGPLGGILSGLLASGERYNFVVACDMPFINRPLIKYMQMVKTGYDVVVPRLNNRYEPLFGIYSKSCSKSIKSLLDKKILKISRFFPKVKVRKISRKEISQFGRPEEIFMNINTPIDLSKLNG
jgi:molybdopterin-guanine dinucleotide biosynthesis protein A